MPTNKQKFISLVVAALNVDYDLNKIQKKDKKKEEDKRKVIKAIYINLHNKELLEAGEIMFCKNTIIRMIMTHLIKYYIKAFSTDSNNKNISNDDSLLDSFLNI